MSATKAKRFLSRPLLHALVGAVQLVCVSIMTAPRPAAAATLSFSTYLGGSGDEADDFLGGVVGVAVDTAGNVYVTGTTQSADFPTTPGANRTLDGNQDVFVTKFSPTGSIVYSTYVGGPCNDIARDIAVDAAGNAYITGRANAGVCLSGPEPGVLVAKLGPTGDLVYSLVFGGSLADSSIGQGIKVDAAGQAYVTGLAASSSGDFPTTPGAFRTTPCDDVWYTADVFVTKINAAGTGFVYSTYLCGTGGDSANGIAIDAAGNAYVAGSTTSRDFPVANALQPSLRSVDGGNGFVAKLSADGAYLVYSTYLGGSADDSIGGIAVDGAGNVYVTGETTSTDFPTTPGVLQEQAGYRLCVPIGPCTDAFVSKIDPSGSALVYSTYLFGELDDSGSRIEVDAGGNAYVVGTTGSEFFPILAPFQPAMGGVFDAFVAKLAADGRGLAYSSFLGGSRSARSLITGWNEGESIALDATGTAYVTGFTQADDFPTTPGAFQQHLGGGGCDSIGLACRDAFVARIDPGGPGVVPAISLRVTPTEAAPGSTLTATWAGIPAATADDVLDLFPLGSWAGAYDAVASWPTGGAAGGTLPLALPLGLASGTYELRLLSPDPNNFNQPTVIARSEPIRMGGSTATQPPVTTTTTTASTTTTTLPCTTARCLLEAGVASPACAGQGVPSSVITKFGKATTLIEGADTSAAKQAQRSLRRARKLLRSAAATTRHAAGGKKPKISSECATVLKASVDQVLSVM
jgi:hypothetical protein